MKFNLEAKTTKDEIYRANLGEGISAVIQLHYHTHYKMWNVTYTIHYNIHFRTDPIFGKEYIETRKEARQIAQQVMNNAKPDDWKTKLDDFNQSNIRASISKKLEFIKI